MKYNGVIPNKSPRVMYAVKDDRGEIQLFSLAGTEAVCKDWFVQGTKLKFSDLEKEGYSIVKLSVWFEVLETND